MRAAVVQIRLDADDWPAQTVVAGGLGLLQSLYLRTSDIALHVYTGTPGQVWDTTIPVDPESKASDYFESIRTSHDQASTLPAEVKSFIARLESSEGWEVSKEKASNSSSSVIPREILCTINNSKTSDLLDLEVNGESSCAQGKFLNQLVHIVGQLLAAASTGQTLRDLDLLCDLDRRDIQRWNQQPPSTIESMVHSATRHRVLESPASQAVESWDGTLTYSELDAFSSRVCALLLESGTQPGECIPLGFEKSLWTVVAMLGVLKSGCSFLLLDVSHPTSRLQTLCAETRARIVLCSAEQEERATGLASMAIPISTHSLSSHAASEWLPIKVHPTDIAVTIFTSGTTGTPKGIQLEHKSLCSSLFALSGLSGISEQTRYFQFSSYAFDAAYGGTICIPSDADRLNNLSQSIRGFNANAVLLTPTVVRLLSPEDTKDFLVWRGVSGILGF